MRFPQLPSAPVGGADGARAGGVSPLSITLPKERERERVREREREREGERGSAYVPCKTETIVALMARAPNSQTRPTTVGGA